MIILKYSFEKIKLLPIYDIHIFPIYLDASFCLLLKSVYKLKLSLNSYKPKLLKFTGLAPLITDPPLISTPLCPTNLNKIKKGDQWHMTCDIWHVTHDTWHMTHDMWYVWGVNIVSKVQPPSSCCLWFMLILRLEGKGSRTELINQWMNHEAVFSTAPPTPGLVITLWAFA